MLKLRYTASAREDLVEIASVGRELHGAEAVELYLKLIQYTVERLCDNPDEIGGKQGPKEVKLFHLRYFSKEVRIDGMRVKQPSHFICYRVVDEKVLEVVRVLRENRSLEELLP